MYRRERIYKEPLKKYNNKKTNTYLISTSSEHRKRKKPVYYCRQLKGSRNVLIQNLKKDRSKTGSVLVRKG
jgi:hypothetical protein